MSEIKGVKVAGEVYSLNDEIVRAALEDLKKQLGDGSLVVGLANAVKAGAITLGMLDENLKLSVSVVNDLKTDDALKPLSANQGKVLKELIDIINGTGEGSTDKKITDAIAKLVDSAPENFDTLKELAEWIEGHGAEVADMLVAINANATAISNETNRAKVAEQEIKSKALHYNSLHAISTADAVRLDGKSVDGTNTLSTYIPLATTESAGVMTAEDKKNVDKVPSSVNGAYWKPWANTVDLKLNKNNGTEGTQSLPAATEYTAGVMTSADKKKLDNLAVEGADVDLNTYVLEGTYFFHSKKLTNVPILNDSVVSARLTVLVAYDGTAPVITQVLNLNNLGGGEGNVYIRSNQGNIWKPWGKLQTNIEVGQVNTLDNLTDNGIYSGVFTDGTPTSYGTYYDTFVLIVINNYSVAGGTGTPHCISQLKYSLKLGGEIVIQKRTSVSGVWGEWSNVGDKYELPVATETTLGGVRIGSGLTMYGEICNVKVGTGMKINGDGSLNPRIGTGLGYTGADITVSIGSGLDFDSTGIRVNNGFGLNIPGSDGKLEWGYYSTWSSSSNMNNYTTPGVYRFYGERTNANDNLPITQAYNGASFYAVLTVIASTLQPDNTEKCVTQFLQLSNRMGGEGNTYIRTYNENNNGLNGWSEWKKQQGMVESYINTVTTGITMTGSQTTGLNGMTENGMYSGIYTDDITLAAPTFVETFVLVVINDYAVSSQAGTPRRISQLKYATDTLTGQCTVKKRVGTGGDSISWSDWEEIGGGSSEVDITDAVKTYGLPTLISQGLAKEGVTYKCSGSFDDDSWLNKLDVNGKIAAKVDSVHGGVDTLLDIYIKITTSNTVVVEVYQTKLETTVDYLLYLHYHKFIMDNSCSYVKVSADMTEL